MDKQPRGIKGVAGLGLRRDKFGGSENARGELLRLKTDSLLAEEGVLVRRALISQMGRVVKRIERGNMNHVREFVVVGGDINKLKDVNTVALGGGQSVGDEVIMNAGRALAAGFRLGAGDLISRVGGDEFVGILFVDEGREDLNHKDLQGSIADRVESIKGKVESGLESIRERYPFLQGTRRGTLDMATRVVSREELVEMWNQEREVEADFVTTLQDLVFPDVQHSKKDDD